MGKILIVDDVVDAVEDLSVLFSAMGHETRAAFDGWGALEVLPSFEPDIVFLDLEMPLLNGYDTAQVIRQMTPSRRPYLIALTASHGTHVHVATKAVGFDSYIRKPADPYQLIALVTELGSRP